MKTLDDSACEMVERHSMNAIGEAEELFTDLDDTSDLPTSLIITNVDISVFTDSEQRTAFEDMFRQFEEEASFHYFKSFRRARVNFSTPDSAAQARIRCHQTTFRENALNCYFAQAASPGECSPGSSLLQPPLPQRQFLISPPASPPVGWEPREEAEPCLSYDIITALASLTPGESHELHPASGSQPGIIVHICEETSPTKSKPKAVIHTRCPEHGSDTSLEESVPQSISSS
uniref:Putative calcineurin-mediated signaling pathway inhibitor dscr1 n=1 Tax=Ornithodoros turicata TaxID=34597 RepID=A0A2R5LG24_9ACAR